MREEVTVTFPNPMILSLVGCAVGAAALHGPAVGARARSAVSMLAMPAGGDLERGRDPERNAALLSLKRSFFTNTDEDAPVATRDAARLGLHLDLPLCRWGLHILPHHRTALNVFQPQYTLMFEKLIAGPQPWLYGHLYLEGGVKNLDSPEHRLEPGSKADLTGTLMQVVAVQRESDSRLSLLVQGVARCIVTRPTQSLPYARADVQLLPDDEELLSSARHAQRFLSSQIDGELQTAQGASLDMGGLRRRLVMAAAIAEENHWREHEHANMSLSVHQTICQVTAPMPVEAARGEAGAIAAGLEQAPMAPAVCYRESGWEESATEEERQAAMEIDDLYAGSTPVLEALQRAVEEAEEEAAEDAEELEPDESDEMAAGLLLLEQTVWVELDLLLRTLNKLRGGPNKAPVPSQLLGLLPPPPEHGGWPDVFNDDGLGGMAAQLKERYDGAIAEEGQLGAARWMHYVPVDHEIYPARRRAQRLSFAVWAVIGGQDVQFQPLLDASSTSDRLRLALLRMRDVMRQIS